MARFHFNEIEFEHECEPDLKFCDSVSNFESMLTLVSLPNLHIPEPTLISVHANLELESLILHSNILLMGTECEHQFFDLDSIFESNLNLKLLLDLNQVPESVLVLAPLTLDPESTILPKSHSIMDQKCHKMTRG